MTGNCLKGSRGIVCFDKSFDEVEWGPLTKELFTQAGHRLNEHLNVLMQWHRFLAFRRVQEEPNLSLIIS